MQPVLRTSLSEITARHLREGFASGRWLGVLPGVRQLAAELGVSRDVLRAALRLLEATGEIVHGGPGRHRQIVTSAPASLKAGMRVGILIPTPLEEDNTHSRQLIHSISQALESLGHTCFIAPRATQSLRHLPAKVRKYMLQCQADAWIVYSAERNILEMAAKLALPVFAIGGSFEDLPLAGSITDLSPSLEMLVHLLTSLGHRQIVLICPPSWRQPELSKKALIFLDCLRQQGINATAHYNVPDWEPTPRGLQDLLSALFVATPPSALVVVEPECVGPILLFLAQQGRRVPEEVSLVNLLPDPIHSFYNFELAHLNWPVAPHVRSMVRWIRELPKRPKRLERTVIHAKFVRGGSIGRRSIP